MLKKEGEMDRRTLTALKKSIEHWERNAQCTAKEAKVGAEFCALCSLFNTEELPPEETCVGCPVREKTGESHCNGSPYFKAVMSTHNGDAAWRSAAGEELAFLKSLLPESGRDPT